MSDAEPPERVRPAHFTREQLERVILGDLPALTSTDVAHAAGVTVEEARRLWRALGFPDAGEAPAFNDADLSALSTLIGTVEAGAIRSFHSPTGRDAVLHLILEGTRTVSPSPPLPR